MDAGQIEQMFVACAGGATLIVLPYLGKGPGWLHSRNGRVICLIGGLLVLGFGVVGAYNSARRKETPNAHAIAAQMREKLKLPVTIDATTRLDDLVAFGDTELGYINTVTSLHAADVDDALRSRLEKSIRERACDNPSVGTLLEYYTVTVVYRTIEATEIVRIQFKPGACQKR